MTNKGEMKSGKSLNVDVTAEEYEEIKRKKKQVGIHAKIVIDGICLG